MKFLDDKNNVLMTDEKTHFLPKIVRLFNSKVCSPYTSFTFLLFLACARFSRHQDYRGHRGVFILNNSETISHITRCFFCSIIKLCFRIIDHHCRVKMCGRVSSSGFEVWNVEGSKCEMSRVRSAKCRGFEMRIIEGFEMFEKIAT